MDYNFSFLLSTVWKLKIGQRNERKQAESRAKEADSPSTTISQEGTRLKLGEPQLWDLVLKDCEWEPRQAGTCFTTHRATQGHSHGWVG